MKKIFLIKLCFVLLIISLVGCGGSNSSLSSGNTGSITAQLDWSGGKSSSILQFLGIHTATAPVGVATVRIIVSGPGMTDIQNDFPASAGQGQIDGVPAGSNRTVTAQGLNSDGNITHQGSIGNVTVTAGLTTDVGTIVMLPIGGNFSNATLNGAWIGFFPQPQTGQNPNYIIFDGNGGVTELGLFNQATPPGSYQVQADGSFTITINPLSDPQLNVIGTLTSSTTGTFTATQASQPVVTGAIIKVSNLAACQGTWSGTLIESGSSVTHNITFTIDANGVETSFTGFAPPVSGKMFCESVSGSVSPVTAFFKTGEASSNPYNQIQIWGALSGNSVTGGLFDNDSAAEPAGAVVLTRSTTSFSQADLTGNWDFVSFAPGANNSNSSNWTIESSTIDSQGNYTCTSHQTSKGETTCGSSGSIVLSIDSSGTVTGVNSGKPDSTFKGNMSLDKNLIVATNTENTNTFGLGVLRKRVAGVTYSNADLANLQFAFHGLFGGSSNTWVYGTGSTNASGQTTIATVNTPSGPGNLPTNPGTILIDSNGIVTLAENSALHGIMTPDKKVIFTVQTSLGVSPAEYEFIAFLVTGQTFTTADLAGTRDFHDIWDTGWNRGTSVTDTAGNQTFLSLLSSSGNSTLPPSDVLSITAGGATTRSDDASFHGQRSFNKDLGVHTNTDANEHSRLGISMKLP